MDFETALTRWAKAERARIDASFAYEATYAQALIHADGKSAEIRKAQADLAALEELRTLQRATCDAKTLEHMVLFLRGSAAEAA